MNTDYSTNRSGVARAMVLTALGVLSCQVFAYDAPTDIYEENDQLFWTADSPSINIYEDGQYIATVHGESTYSPIYTGSSYQLVSHDHGTEFTDLSEPFLYIDTDDPEDTDNDEALEYDEAKLYFELNDSDGDLGLHALVDGETWKSMTIEDTTGRTVFEVAVTNGLLAQGMTEIFFESAEPAFDELDPVDFFSRFPAGQYEVNGITIDGQELESELELSHVIPAAPSNIIANGQLLPVDCDVDNGPAVLSPVLLVWDPVASSHATLGTTGDVEVRGYQVVLEREEPTPFKVSIDVAGDVTQLTLPTGLTNAGDELKIEVLTIAETGNQSATESCLSSAN